MSRDQETPIEDHAPSPLVFFRRREVEEHARDAVRLATLRAALPALVQLIEDAGGVDVRLFGSVADGTVHADSDIDLGVSGLSSSAYFRLLGELLAAAPAPVDLVEMERAPASLRDHILATGVRLSRAEGPTS